MTQSTYWWAVFMAVINPLCLRAGTDPVWLTVAQIVMCLVFVAIADRRERRA